jgi:hypothetical protein
MTQILERQNCDIVDQVNVRIIQIWFMRWSDRDNAQYVWVLPTRGICDYTDSRHPLTMIHAPTLFMPEGFLDWIASICAYELPEGHYPFKLRGETPDHLYYVVPLQRTMDTDQLIKICGFDNEVTEKWLKRHATFTGEDDNA